MQDINNCPYINTRDYILYHAGELGLSSDELLICLLIDFANEKNININYQYFMKALNKEEQDIDMILKSLVTKAILKLNVKNGSFDYDISGLFKTEPKSLNKHKDIFDIFADVFGRDLNGQEMEKLNDLLNIYTKEDLLKALRLADAYRKRDLLYIEGILKGRHNG